MSAVLPVAEQMLSEHHALHPFGSTLSSAGEITQVGGWLAGAAPEAAVSIRELEASFRDGAQRGELKATALVRSVPFSAPGTNEVGQAVAVQLDHRVDYSLVVTFPYRFLATGELLIEEPFASEGAHDIFQH